MCNNLGTDFASLLESGAMSDVTLITQDDPPSRIQAHKLILAARSPVFAAAFLEESADRCTELQVPSDFGDFLKYVYSGSIELHAGNVCQVGFFAQFFLCRFPLF